jgi:hypothetical protein
MADFASLVCHDEMMRYIEGHYLSNTRVQVWLLYILPSILLSPTDGRIAFFQNEDGRILGDFRERAKIDLS